MRGSEPHWYRDAILYELHVRAYADSDGDGIGDFRGLTEKLDYLRDLGVSALWLLPFYPSPLRDGGYDIRDYYGVHPDYGTKEDFLRFLEAAHARGLRVITELVVNHTSSEHPWFQRARRAPPGSTERDFYVWSDSPDRYAGARIIFKDFETSNWTWDPVARAYYWHRFYAHQPDLNFDNPAVQDALFEVLDHWLGLGVDGVRLDAVPYLFEREGTSCENLPETHAFLKRLRAHVDAKFEGKMLLAEANQWPADAARYFGDGDECHMNFHFPLMPRLFMAVAQEDSFPVVDILAQTPPIPESCQWATFLRNHDELTLEMVTEEDRDVMVRGYAKDSRARLNLGIRRRLAPLLGDRRRLELLEAILFSLPGAPVLYYGDEIGMGDNIYLGDRDGVRTPMQWSADRNAGFSRGNPQRLYLPVVVDPHFHFEAVNVEAQHADPSSLLWWTRYLIHARRSRPLFSRGSIRFVENDNPKLLTFVREHEGEQLLFVANLSRFSQYATLQLGDYVGKVPIEAQGKARFPRIDGDTWGISLGPYDFIWLDLRSPQGTEHRSRDPLVAPGPWWTLAETRPEELALRLAAHVASRPGRSGSLADLGGCALRDVARLELGDERALLALVQLDWAAGRSETHVVPLAHAGGPAARELLSAGRAEVVAELEDGADLAGEGPSLLVDPTHARSFALQLLRALRDAHAAPGVSGAMLFSPEPGLVDALGGIAAEPRLVDVDRTNVVVLYGTQLALKLLRHVDEGPNAEVETLRLLEARPSPDGHHLAPRLLGTIAYRPREGAETLVGIATEYVANRGTARDLFSDALQADLERTLARAELAPPSMRAPVAATTAGASDDHEPAEPLPSLTDRLAQRTAELHRALASATGDDAPVPFDVLHQQSLHQSARMALTRALGRLRRQRTTLSEEDRELASRLATAEPRLHEALHEVTAAGIEALRTRTHGDLHLGEVLFTGDDFVFVDFEGERTRPPRERRYKRCPLRDVAGLVRSFDRTADTTLLRGRVRPGDRERLEPRVRVWARRLAGRLIDGYVGRLAGTPLVPHRIEHTRVLLRFYVLERCIQELARTLEERPSELAIPLRALLRISEATHII